MNVKLTLFALTTLALAAGAAQAQAVAVTTGSGSVGAGSYSISATSASVSQTITVTVPKRFGLHLHLSTWNLDLGQVNDTGDYTTAPSTTPPTNIADANCVRAGDHSSTSGRDYLYQVGSTQTTKDAKILSLLNGATYEGDQYADTTGNAYSYAGTLSWPAPTNARSGTGTSETFVTGTPGTPGTGVGGTINESIGGYPGFYVSQGSLVWKGPIMCSFQTIVQKFSNSSNGFFFSAALTTAPGTTTGKVFPSLYVRDFIKPPLSTGVTTSSVVLNSGATPASLLATGTGTTGGWLDDHLLQVLVFDGSETNGTYVGNVTYTLTDTSPTGL